MSAVEFDDLFQYIGNFGKVQRNVLLIYCLANLLFGWVYFGQMFMTLTPPHICKQNHYSENDHLNHNETTWYNTTGTDYGIDPTICSEYHGNETEFESGLVLDEQLLSNSVPCSSGWIYDYTDHYPTITSELDWVCENDWLPPLAQLIFFLGAFSGTIGFGYLADMYGRVPAHAAVNLLGGIAGIASCFSWSFATFAVCRFFVGMSHDWCYMCIYILILEYVSPAHRSMAACAPAFIFFTLGFCSLPWLAKGLGNWKWLGIVIHCTQLILAAGALFVPESCRWLLSQGRSEEAVTILRNMAADNNNSIPDDVIKQLKVVYTKEDPSEVTRVSWTDLLKTPVLRKRFISQCVIWCSMTVIYDVYFRNSEHLGGSSVFVDFTLAGLMELPGGIIPLIAMETLGRKMTAIITLVSVSVGTLIIACIKRDQWYIILGLTLFGCISGSVMMNLIHQYSVELIPTVARGQGMATLTTIAKLSVLVSPYIVYLDKYGQWIPYTVIFPLVLASAFAALYLPETLHQKLPDTLEEGETFMTNETIFKRMRHYNSTTESHDNEGFEDIPARLQTFELHSPN